MFRYIHIIWFLGILVSPIHAFAAPTDSKASSGKAAPATREAKDNESEQAERSEIRRFVDDLISREQARDIDSLIQLYAEKIRVDGKLESRNQLKKDFEVYFKRWPQAKWSRQWGYPDVKKISDGSVEVMYKARFEVSNPESSKTKKGITKIYLTLQKHDGKYLIKATRDEIVSILTSDKDKGTDNVSLSSNGDTSARVVRAGDTLQATGLLAEYIFSGNLKDTSGNKNHLINPANLSYGMDRLGNANQALVFNGSNGTAQSTRPIGIVGNSPRTVSVWIKAEAGGVQCNSYVLGYGSYIPNGAVNGLLFQTWGGRDQFQMWGSYLDTTTKAPLSFWSRNSWHHICYVYSGSVSQSKFFIDGNAVESSKSMFGRGDVWNTVNTVLTIGKSPYFNPGFDAFEGMSIDDLRIYNRDLSDAEVQQLFMPLYHLFMYN